MLQHEAEYIDARPLTTDSSNLLATHGRTIHLGQKRTFRNVQRMSALPPKADTDQHGCDVRFVPKADITQRAGRYSITLREVAGVLAKAPKKAGGSVQEKRGCAVRLTRGLNYGAIVSVPGEMKLPREASDRIYARREISLRPTRQVGALVQPCPGYYSRQQA